MTATTVVRTTMMVATIVWAVGEAAMARQSVTGDRTVRAIWTMALALTIVHVLLAFELVYAWDHEAAVAATVQQSVDRFGRGWRGGISVNYLFLAIWIADVTWWWVAPASHASRPAWIDWGRRAFFLFMFINGAIVFAAGVGRLVGIVAVSSVLIAEAAARVQVARNASRSL